MKDLVDGLRFEILLITPNVDVELNLDTKFT